MRCDLSMLLGYDSETQLGDWLYKGFGSQGVSTHGYDLQPNNRCLNSTSEVASQIDQVLADRQ